MSTQINPFDRSQYPKDAVYATRPTNHFNGEITSSKTLSNKKTLEIDGAVYIETTDDKTREAALKYFENLKTNANALKDETQTEFYKDIGITVMGVGAAIGCCFLPILPGIVAGVASGIGLAIFGIKKAIEDHALVNEIECDINTMKDQGDEWKDPTLNVITQRKNAGILGFQYVYKNKLKETIIHPEEVKQLWQQNFKQLLSCSQSIQQMCEENLLSSGSVKYAWGYDHLPEMNVNGRYFSRNDLKSLTLQFDACRTSFQHFNSAINQQLDILLKEKNEIKQQINHMKTRWMLPAEYSYSQGKQTAATLHQQALAPFINEKNAAIHKVKQDYRYIVNNSLDADEIVYKQNLDKLCEQEIRHINQQYESHPSVISINQAYDRDIRMCNFLYNQSQLVVNTFFDQRIRKLESSYSRNQTMIEEQRTAGSLRFKHLMDQALIHPGFSLSDHPMPVVQQYRSLPSLNSEPSWGEVYGNAPSFHSGLVNDVSEFAWNHFWSNNGLGHFASFPTSSWSSQSFERTTMPFANRFFNLHHVQHHAQPRMFMREIRVPVRPTARRMPHETPINTAPTHTPPPPSTRTATGFGGTTRREPNVNPGERRPEKRDDAHPQLRPQEATRVNPGEKTPVGNTNKANERVTPGTRESGTTRTAAGFGGSSRR